MRVYGISLDLSSIFFGFKRIKLKKKKKKYSQMRKRHQLKTKTNKHFAYTMNVLLLCILWALLQNTGVAKGSSLDEQTTSKEESNSGRANVNTPNPSHFSEKASSASQMKTYHFYKSVDASVPSTSRDVQYSSLPIESAPVFSYEKTTEELKELAPEDITTQRAHTLDQTADTISEISSTTTSGKREMVSPNIVPNKRLTSVIVSNPFYCSKKSSLVSQMETDHLYKSTDVAVPSTSKAVQYSSLPIESASFSLYEKTTEELKELTPEDITDQRAHTLYQTANTISETSSTTTSGKREMVSPNIVPNKSPHSPKFKNGLSDLSTNSSEADVDTAQDRSTQKNTAATAGYSPNDTECPGTSSNVEADKSTNSADVNVDHNIESADHPRSNAPCGYTFLKLEDGDFRDWANIMTHIHHVMIRCNVVNEAECNKGLNLILNTLDRFKDKLPVVPHKKGKTCFHKYAETMYNRKGCYCFAEKINYTEDLLNSFSVYMLCLFIICQAPIRDNYIFNNKSRLILTKKKMLNNKMITHIMKSNLNKNYMSWCNKLKCITHVNEKYLSLLRFAYLLFEEEDSDSIALQRKVFRCFNKTLSIFNKFTSFLKWWSTKSVLVSEYMKNIIRDMNALQSEAMQFKSLLEQLLQIICEKITPKFKNVTTVVDFLIYWVGILYIEFIGIKKESPLNLLFGACIFQTFLKECKLNMIALEMMEHQEVSFFSENIAILPLFFMYTSLRLCDNILYLITKSITLANDELKQVELKRMVYNKVEYSVFLNVLNMFYYTTYENQLVLCKIKRKQKQMQHLQSIIKLVIKINNDVDNLKEQKNVCMLLRDDMHRVVLKDQYKQISKYYTQLFNLLNANDDDGSDNE